MSSTKAEDMLTSISLEAVKALLVDNEIEVPSNMDGQSETAINFYMFQQFASQINVLFEEQEGLLDSVAKAKNDNEILQKILAKTLKRVESLERKMKRRAKRDD